MPRPPKLPDSSLLGRRVGPPPLPSWAARPRVAASFIDITDMAESIPPGSSLFPAPDSRLPDSTKKR